MKVKWTDIPIFLMDFEGSPRSGVVEYGVVELNQGEINSCETGLCSPELEMSEREIAVHQIPPESLAGKSEFKTNFKLFLEFRKKGVFGAHNAHVENKFLKDTWSHPPFVPDWSSDPGAVLASWGPWLDTLGLYRNIYPGLGSYRLMDLVKQFQLLDTLNAKANECCPEGRKKAHCALYDSLASAFLLLRLLAEDGFPDASLKWMLEYSKSKDAQIELF